MKFKLAAAALCAAGISMPALAGDADDIKATIAKAQAAYNACDSAALQGLTNPNFFGFNPDGTLTEGNDMAQMKAACEAGAKYEYTIEARKIHVGNGWAVVAGHTTGKVTPPKGEAQPVDSHFTVVLVKDGGGWQSLHLHGSANVKPAQ